MRNEVRKSQPESTIERWEDLSHELWEVQVGPGLGTLMTLDELDAAFKSDEIGTRTLVRRPGTLHWKTLAEIAGIEPSTLTLESESLVPVASDVALPQVPKLAPPPLPLPLPTLKEVDALTTAELSVVRPRTLRRRLTSLAVVAVVGMGVFAAVSVLLSSAYGPLPEGSTSLAMEAPVPVLELPSSPAVAAPLLAPAGEVAPAAVAPAPTLEPVVDSGAVLVFNRPGSTLQRRAPAARPVPQVSTAKKGVAKKPAKTKKR